MEQLKPKFYLALVFCLFYNLPRLYLNVHIFGSICSLYYNIILGQFLPQDKRSINSYPRQMIYNEMLPPYLLKFINAPHEIELLFELQHSTAAMPFYHMSPMCTFHLDSMRDSWAFQLYFVMSDCLVLVIVIISVTYCTFFFFLEIKKSLEFRETCTVGRRPFWTLPRLSFLFTAVLTISMLIIQISFSVYWLIIDFDGVFMIQIIRYIEIFYFYSITIYMTFLSFIKLMQLSMFNQ